MLVLMTEGSQLFVMPLLPMVTTLVLPTFTPLQVKMQFNQIFPKSVTSLNNWQA